MKRYEISNCEWERIKDKLPAERTGKRGRPAKNNRIMLNGMLWIARTGAQWREMPECYGSWQSVYARFRKWQKDGVWEEIFHTLSSDADSKHAIDLLKKVDITKSNILGDKAYGSKEIRLYITENGESYTMPPKSNTKEPWACDYDLYKERHLVECFFQNYK